MEEFPKLWLYEKSLFVFVVEKPEEKNSGSSEDSNGGKKNAPGT